MIKTQVQIPEQLYLAAKRVAKDREWSLAEVMRRGLEHVVTIYPALDDETWNLPVVNEGEGPPVTLEAIQLARIEDSDRLQ
jgi:hypothetical protein